MNEPSNPPTTSRRRKLLGDAGALFLVQGLGFLIPLATLPFLVRTLGPAAFGSFGMAVAFSGYLQILLEYGFWLSGTKQAVRCLNDPDRLSQLYWSIHGAKILLLLVALIPMTATIVWVPNLRTHATSICILSFGVVGSSLFPLWLLQAQGRIQVIAWITTGVKLSNLAIFFLIREPGDLRSLVWFIAIQSWVHGLVGQWISLRGWKLSGPSTRWLLDSFHQVRSDSTIFVSQLNGLLVANTTTLVLGSTVSSAALGSFLIADRIARAAAGLTGPLSQSVLPETSRLFHHDTVQNALRFLRRFLLTAGSAIALGCIALFFLAPLATRLVAGRQIPETIIALRIMSIYPLMVFLNNFLGPQLLIQLGREDAILRASLVAGALALVLQQILLHRFEGTGAASIVVIAEATSVVILSAYVLKYRRSKLAKQ